MRLLSLAAMLVLASGMTGCLDDNGDPEPEGEDPDATTTTTRTVTDTSTTTQTQTGTQTTTTTETGDGADDATRWMGENRTGNVSGFELIADGPDPANETVVINDTVLTAWFNLSVEGDPLAVSLALPNGTSQDVALSNGSAALRFEAPQAGDWTVTLEADGEPGAFDASYTLVLAREVPQ